MRTPVVLVTGVDPTAMSAVTVGLQWDLPNAVAVQHRIDPERQVLHRIVSDVTGVLDREEITLEHACVTCAIREDVIPTIERCARDGRWKTVIAHLPVGAEGDQVCAVVNWDTRLARHIRVAGVVAALDGSTLVADLLGDALLRERGLHSAADDTRGVGEVACAQIEYADLVVVAGGSDAVGRGLVRTLARPDAVLVEGAEHVDGAELLDRSHAHDAAVAWVDPTFDEELPEPDLPQVWRIDLRSPRAFHPDRLLADLELIGGGEHRSRGCFWLPSRPGKALVWDGAGGQLSIGTGRPWGRRAPFTRIVLTGVGEPPAGLEDAFDDLLLGPDLEGRSWHVEEDGFEPWLGNIRDLDLPA
jgi:G3E family GTPase